MIIQSEEIYTLEYQDTLGYAVFANVSGIPKTQMTAWKPKKEYLIPKFRELVDSFRKRQEEAEQIKEEQQMLVDEYTENFNKHSVQVTEKTYVVRTQRRIILHYTFGGEPYEYKLERSEHDGLSDEELLFYYRDIARKLYISAEIKRLTGTGGNKSLMMLMSGKQIPDNFKPD